MRYSVSDTAEYGDYTRGPRVVSDETKAEMKKILGEIQSGQFAREWVLENQANRAGVPGHAAARRRAPDRGGRQAAALDDVLDQAAERVTGDRSFRSPRKGGRSSPCRARSRARPGAARPPPARAVRSRRPRWPRRASTAIPSAPSRRWSGGLLSPADGRVMSVRGRRRSVRGAGGAGGDLPVAAGRATSTASPHRRRGDAPRCTRRAASWRPTTRVPKPNERCAIRLQGEHARVTVVQIAGVVARRIVCRVGSGDKLSAGRPAGHDPLRLADRLLHAARHRGHRPGG